MIGPVGPLYVGDHLIRKHANSHGQRSAVIFRKRCPAPRASSEFPGGANDGRRVGHRRLREILRRKAEDMRRFIMVAAIGAMLGLGLGGLTGGVRADGGNITTVGPYGTDSYTRYFGAG